MPFLLTILGTCIFIPVQIYGTKIPANTPWGRGLRVPKVQNALPVFAHLERAVIGHGDAGCQFLNIL
jgi:hypothetical protein